MRDFSFDNPSSNYAIPSASLMIDTCIAGQEWEKTDEVAHDLMEIKQWKSGEFSKRLFAVASDAYYKMMEARYAKNDYRGTLEMADTFMTRYRSSERLPDVLSLAGQSSMIDNQKDRALKYFSKPTVTESPKSGNAAAALLARAQIEEDHYEFAQASADYQSLLALSPCAGRCRMAWDRFSST